MEAGDRVVVVYTERLVSRRTGAEMVARAAEATTEVHQRPAERTEVLPIGHIHARSASHMAAPAG